MDKYEIISNSSFKQMNPHSRQNQIKEDMSGNKLSSNIFLFDKVEKRSKNKVKENSKRRDFASQNSLFLSSEDSSIESKKHKIKQKKIEKRYIVDDIDNIFVLLKEPKLKLRIQEILHYFIIFLICVYYWIFLFLTGIKFENNYFLTDYSQFNACSDEQVCEFPENSANVIIYNSSFNYSNLSSNDKDFFINEYNNVNDFYRAYFIKYESMLNKYKLTLSLETDYISDKPMLSVVIINKENWNLYFKYFSLCEFDNYYFAMIFIVAIGGILGSIFFGFLSDIFGRRLIILITLFISFIGTFCIYILSLRLDLFYENELNYFQEKCLRDDITCSDDLLTVVYAQGRTKEKFRDLYIYYLFCIFLLNFSLWPLLKSCMALLVENSNGELEVLINFRRYNFFFQGLPPLCTSLIFVNLNNFTATFLILSITNLITLILSLLFLDESIRYYYEYSEWENLTKVFLNTYKINLEDFRTLTEEQLKKFKKKENSKSFNKINTSLYDYKGKSFFGIKQSFYKNIVEAKSALNRNIKRNIDFIIKLEDVKSHPILIITALWANHSLKDSKTLLMIILILLYIIMDLFQKELLEPPYFSTKDLYFGKGFNYIINSIFFIYLIINIMSNYVFYLFYRIGYFKIIIYISEFITSLTLIIYHFIVIKVKETPMNFNEYNFNMLSYFSRDIRSNANLLLLFIIYFALNGVIFYVYLLILKISKTIYRCTFFALHSVALVIAVVVSEFIYYHCENYFLFLGVLNLFCTLLFFYLNESKELIYIMNDLKVNMFGIKKDNWKEKFKTI